jgi:hypothetical protein
MCIFIYGQDMLRAVDVIKLKLADDTMHEAKRIMTFY